MKSRNRRQPRQNRQPLRTVAYALIAATVLVENGQLDQIPRGGNGCGV